MGIALIVLGLLAAGIVVDFAAENWSAGTADLTFELFGGSFTLTQMQVVLGAAVLGAVAVPTPAETHSLLGTSWSNVVPPIPMYLSVVANQGMSVALN